MTDLTDTNKLLKRIAAALEGICFHTETLSDAAHAPTDIAIELRAIRTGDNPKVDELITERDLLRAALDEANSRLKAYQ